MEDLDVPLAWSPPEIVGDPKHLIFRILHEAICLRRADSVSRAVTLIGLRATPRAAARRKGNQLSAENPSRSHEARPHGNGAHVEFVGDLRRGLVLENPGHDVL